MPKFTALSAIFGASSPAPLAALFFTPLATATSASGRASMYERSAARASSSSVPVKQEPWSLIANMLRDDTSRRAKVRRNNPTVSRTSQSSREFAKTVSTCMTAGISPSVFRRKSPSSRSFLNRLGKICGSYDFVDESPRLRAFALHAVGIGAKQIGEVAAHFAFIHHAR